MSASEETSNSSLVFVEEVPANMSDGSSSSSSTWEDVTTVVLNVQNHALEDYQRQLQLLEVANKLRLEHARAAQNKSGSAAARPPTTSSISCRSSATPDSTSNPAAGGPSLTPIPGQHHHEVTRLEYMRSQPPPNLRAGISLMVGPQWDAQPPSAKIDTLTSFQSRLADWEQQSRHRILVCPRNEEGKLCVAGDNTGTPNTSEPSSPGDEYLAKYQEKLTDHQQECEESMAWVKSAMAALGQAAKPKFEPTSHDGAGMLIDALDDKKTHESVGFKLSSGSTKKGHLEKLSSATPVRKLEFTTFPIEGDTSSPNTLSHQRERAFHSSPGPPTLYQVCCSLYNRNGQLVLDEPKTCPAWPLVNYDYLLRPDNLQRWMDEEGLSFVVIKRCRCPSDSHTCLPLPADTILLRSDLQLSMKKKGFRFHDKTTRKSQTDTWSLVADNVPIECSLPWLYHHRDILVAISKEAGFASDGATNLIRYLGGCNSMGKILSLCSTDFQQGLVSKETRDFLFVPNEAVVWNHATGVRSDLLDDWPDYGEENEFTMSTWQWDCWRPDEMRKLKTVSVKMEINGHVRITSLKVYPMRFASPQTRRMLVESGKNFWEYRIPSYVSYQGWDADGKTHFEPGSRFVINTKLPSASRPSSQALQTTGSDRWGNGLTAGGTIKDADFAVLPITVWGFYVIDKETRLVPLVVRNITPVTWNKTDYERIDPSNKDLIQGLLTTPSLRYPFPAKGPALLLHGSPGTGKTFSVQTLAEVVERPLLQVSCRALTIGNPPPHSLSLSTLLDLTISHNGILLLDASDVTHEVLHSDILRLLRGTTATVVVTTNRKDHPDEAVRSQFRACVTFRELGEYAQRHVWAAQLLPEGCESLMDQLLKLKLNGWQIVNLVAAARQLAASRGEELGCSHIEQFYYLADNERRYRVCTLGYV